MTQEQFEAHKAEAIAKLMAWDAARRAGGQKEFPDCN